MLVKDGIGGTDNWQPPDHAANFMALGRQFESTNDRRRACDAYLAAWTLEPENIAAGIAHARTKFDDDPRETVRVMGRLLDGASDADKLQIYSALLFYKEFSARIDRGLMPYHATSLDEMFFKYCAADFLKYRDLAYMSDDLVHQFTARFCGGHLKGAQAVLRLFQDGVKPNHVWHNVNFDPAFYASLNAMTGADILRPFPETYGISRAHDAEQVVWLGCDGAYLEAFAAPMIRSLREVMPNAAVHVHAMDITDQQFKLAAKLGIGLTVEKSPTPGPAYYHAVRFVRYWQYLQTAERPVWLMDVDALFNREPSQMFSKLNNTDVALRVRAGRFEPWNQFNACIVGAQPTPASMTYFRLIAAYISHYYQCRNLQWGVDQLAMYGVHEWLRESGDAPSLAFLDDSDIDYDYRDDGIVWCNSGKNKHLHTQRGPDGKRLHADPDREKYLEKFDRYQG